MTKSLAPEVEKLRKEFNIIGVPTVIIIDSEGDEVKRITGFVPAEEFLNLLKEIK
jgi:thiol:disulfide interchange protein DsbD